MANEIKLEVYTFKVREKKASEHLVLSNFFGGNDFMNFIQQFFDQHDKNILVNPKMKKSFQIIADKILIESKQRSVSGVIESGDYGIETKILSQDGKHKFTRGEEDIDAKPFYFLLHVPTGSRIGYIVLERIGVHGINHLFQHSLNGYFDAQFPNHIIDFAQFLSRELARSFLKDGGIQEFTLTRYNLPKDIVDKLDLAEMEESIKGIQLRIFAKPRKYLPINKKVEKFVENKNAGFFDVKPLAEFGFDGQHDSSVKVKVKGKTRTIDLSETGQIRPYYDIDNEVKKEKGHPVFSSIDEIAKSLLSDLIKNT